MKSLQEFVSHSCPGYLFTSREVDERVAATRKATLEEVREKYAAVFFAASGWYPNANEFSRWLTAQLAGGDE